MAALPRMSDDLVLRRSEQSFRQWRLTAFPERRTRCLYYFYERRGKSEIEGRRGNLAGAHSAAKDTPPHCRRWSIVARRSASLQDAQTKRSQRAVAAAAANNPLGQTGLSMHAGVAQALKSGSSGSVFRQFSGRVTGAAVAIQAQEQEELSWIP